MKVRRFNEKLSSIDKPEAGDYVIMNTFKGDLKEFVANNIGRFVKFVGRKVGQSEKKILVHFDCDIPEDIQHYFRKGTRIFNFNQIIYLSKDDIEDLKLYIDVNKYNL